MVDTPGLFNYVIYVLLMMIGFYAVIAKNNLVKKVIGLGLFQTGIFLFYISLAVIEGGQSPVRDHAVAEDVKQVFVNPLPHVLILTAIVVSVSIMAVALAVVINIQRQYGTVEIDEIDAINQSYWEAEECRGE